MFNAIFLSVWSELQEKQQTELAESLQQALTTQNIPEITQTLLNLAEFMEHCEKVIYFNAYEKEELLIFITITCLNL